MKKKTKQKLIDLLEILSNDWNWKKLERNNNSWGDCSVHEDDVVKIDIRWKEVSQLILDEIKPKTIKE